MGALQQEQEERNEKYSKSKKIWAWIATGGLTGIATILLNLNVVIDQSENIIKKIPIFSMEHSKKAETTTKTKENSNEELLKSNRKYKYKVRVITYSARNMATAYWLKDTLNSYFAKGKYDEFEDNPQKIEVEEEARVTDRVVKIKGKDEVVYFVYVRETEGTIRDMVRDYKVLDSKYEEMFKKEGWLGTKGYWEGLVIDYYKDPDMENFESLDAIQLFNLQQQLYKN